MPKLTSNQESEHAEGAGSLVTVSPGLPAAIEHPPLSPAPDLPGPGPLSHPRDRAGPGGGGGVGSPVPASGALGAENTEGCAWQHGIGSALFTSLWYFCQNISCGILTCQADSRGAVLAEWGRETQSPGAASTLHPSVGPEGAARVTVGQPPDLSTSRLERGDGDRLPGVTVSLQVLALMKRPY